MSKVILSLVITLFSLSCQNNNPVSSAESFNPNELLGTTLSVFTKNENSDILMGILSFDNFNADSVSGRWRFESWGEQPLFYPLPVNSGEKFPALADLGVFKGFIFGDELIITFTLPDTDVTVGIVLNRKTGNKIKGELTLLPDKKFVGRLEGIIVE